MKPRHIAVVSGLALTLAFGAVHVTTPAFAEGDSGAQQGAGAAAGTGADGAADGTGSDAAGGELPAPSSYDKADFYEDAPAVATFSARSSASSSLSSVTVTNEMKYFTKYESHSNYRQGFGSGDGYNALGYYQFDRRYSLIPFLAAVYNANPTKYAMLKPVLDRKSEVTSADSLYDSDARALSSLGQLVQDAWFAAYDVDPSEFSAFQDAYAYNSYYVPTEKWLKSELGIDMSGRADCVKGMVWGLSNLWGTGGVKKVLRGANLSNSMSDREFVTALSAQMTDNIEKYSSQTKYYTGWRNRYRSELNDCIAYIVLHDAQDDAADQGGSDDAGTAGDVGTAGDAGADHGDAGADGDGSAVDEDAGSSAADDDAADGSGSGAEDAGAADDSAGSGGQAADGSEDASGSQQDGAASGTDGSASGSGNGAPSNGASDGEDASDGVSSAGGSVSKPSLVPGKPTGNGSAGSGTGADEGDDSADGAASGKEEANGTTGLPDEAEETEEPKTESGEDEKTDPATSPTTVNETDDSTKTGEDERSEGTDEEDGPGEAGGSEGTSDTDPDDVGDNDGGAARMPQTSDLVMLVSLAGASAATFGATFIAAGKHGLSKRKDDDAE